jgi:ParB/RepB/Spo0J family partition protein
MANKETKTAKTAKTEGAKTAKIEEKKADIFKPTVTPKDLSGVNPNQDIIEIVREWLETREIGYSLTANNEIQTSLPAEYLDFMQKTIREIKLERLDSIEESILSKGQLQNVLVTPEIQGDSLFLFVIAGNHRTAAMQGSGYKLNILIRKDLTLTHSLIENIKRYKMEPAEIIRYVKELVEVQGMNFYQISKETGISEATIEKYFGLQNLKPEEMKALKEKKITVGQAEYIAKLQKGSNPLTDEQRGKIFENATIGNSVESLKSDAKKLRKLKRNAETEKIVNPEFVYNGNFSQERLDKQFQAYESLKESLELEKREPDEKEKVFINTIEDIFCLKSEDIEKEYTKFKALHNIK